MEPHDFVFIDGVWICTTEFVDADECTDYNRCNYDCVCNNKELV